MKYKFDKCPYGLTVRLFFPPDTRCLCGPKKKRTSGALLRGDEGGERELKSHGPRSYFCCRTTYPKRGDDDSMGTRLHDTDGTAGRRVLALVHVCQHSKPDGHNDWRKGINYRRPETAITPVHVGYASMTAPGRAPRRRERRARESRVIWGAGTSIMASGGRDLIL